MPRASPGLFAFNAGQLGPRLEGRVDLAKYRNGCRTMRNFLPLVQGGVTKRSGTRFVREVKASPDPTHLIPFSFNVEQEYVLEFGDEYFRIFRNGGIVLDGGPVEVVTPYAAEDVGRIQWAQSADVLYLAHPDYPPQKIQRTSHTAWTIEAIAFEWPPFDDENTDKDDLMTASAATGSVTLTSTGGHFTAGMVGSYVKLAERFEGNHPEWRAGSNLDFAHSTYTYTVGDRAWYEGNVYQLIDQNGQSTTGQLAPVHKEGTKTDGRWDWKYINSGAGYALITAVTDAYRAVATVQVELPRAVVYADRSISTIVLSGSTPVEIQTGSDHDLQTGDQVWIQDVVGTTEVNQQVWTVTRNSSTSFDLNGTNSSLFTAYSSGGIVVRVKKGDVLPLPVDGEDHDLWSLGAFSGESGYPRSVSFFEDRLWWARGQTLWASRTSDYENHESTDEDESALSYTLLTERQNIIEWLSPGKVLVAGTAGEEFVGSASSIEEALTPTNVRFVSNTTHGSRSGVRPVRVEGVVLFVQRSGRKLREYVYNFDQDSYVAPDMTRLSDEITLGQVSRMSFQQEPNRIVWCVLADGGLVGMTYERNEDVIAWHEQSIGGSDVLVESVATIEHPDGDGNQVWLVVSRTIDGNTVRYVEYFEKDWVRTNDLEDAYFLDSMLTYDSTPATSISGLDHLEGELVHVLADGAYAGTFTVASGSITLPEAASAVQVGLAYDADLETMRIEAGAADGVSQGKQGQVNSIAVLLDQTGPGLFFGPELNVSRMEQLLLRDQDDFMDTAVPLFDGMTKNYSFKGSSTQDRRVALRHSLPYPCTVTAIFPTLKAEPY